MEQLRGAFALPILKIDEPMARQAARLGKKVGVVVTFPPTLEPTCKLLNEAAADAGTSLDLLTEVVPEAYQALLSGNHQMHDELLLAALKRLAEQDPAAIVLAQVSMARILSLPDWAQLKGQVKAPVLSSLHTSLEAVRAALPEQS